MKYSLQNKKGYYHAVVSYKDENGKHRQKSISTRIPAQKGNKRRAEKTADKLVSSWLTQREQIENEKKDPTIPKAIEMFNESKKKSVQNTTYAGYVRLGNKITKYFGSVNISKIDRNYIGRFLTSIREKGSGENTVRHYCVYLNSMFQFLQNEGYSLPSNGFHIKPPSVPKYTGASYFSTEEVRTLLAAADASKIRIPVYIAIFLGLRRSELCGLYWDKVDLQSRTIRICRKTVQYCDANGKETTEMSEKMKTIYSDRTLPIPDSLYSILFSVENKTGLVCRHEDGRAMAPQYISAAFSKLLKKAGLRKIRFHDLRHSCASLLLSSGAGMKEVQVILGHGSYATTADIYSHIDLTGKTRAIAGLNRIIEASD